MQDVYEARPALSATTNSARRPPAPARHTHTRAHTPPHARARAMVLQISAPRGVTPFYTTPNKIDGVMAFYNACESGKGYDACKEYCVADATFASQSGLCGRQWRARACRP